MENLRLVTQNIRHDYLLNFNFKLCHFTIIDIRHNMGLVYTQKIGPQYIFSTCNEKYIICPSYSIIQKEGTS